MFVRLKKFQTITMSLGTVNNPAIDNLIETSESHDDETFSLKWIPYSKITSIKPTQIDNVSYAVRETPYGYCYEDDELMLLLLGSSEECTPTLVSEFARIYSLPTHKYNNSDNNFKRYSKLLENRNNLIWGFTSHDDKYYMVANRWFYHCYSRYGFCTACGILRCSPVWCICGQKELSDGWTSNNKQLDAFIKKSQLQTNSPNHAYLEWIPSDCIENWEDYAELYGLPTDERVKLIPLDIKDKTHDSYYVELCRTHPDILDTDIWITIGFTYDNRWRRYCLIIEEHWARICLACLKLLNSTMKLFCLKCKAPRPVDWTTGNKPLDSFIMESWSNTRNEYDAYIQWIEYSLLSNVQEATLLRHGCTHVADWLDSTTNKLTRVSLKKIVDEQNDQVFDFHQLTKEHPDISTPDNVWILGITQVPSTREYYLVFYHNIHALLDRFIQNNRRVNYMQYSNFRELKEIGSDGHGTVYTAECTVIPGIVVLKRFKSFDGIPELFINEFRSHARCSKTVYGVTQDPETKEYMIVMQYATNGSLLSFLDNNINKLTWKKKLQCLKHIAQSLHLIHDSGLVHCNLHERSIAFCYETPLIYDFDFSRSVNSRQRISTLRGALPFIAPEVFRTRKFTQKSDVYSLGIIMYLMAAGESPFRNRQSDESLMRDIMGGLRPSMPDSAPEEYKKLAERCCDADPDERPDADRLGWDISNLITKVDKDDSISNVWNTIYHNDVKPLSGLEESK